MSRTHTSLLRQAPSNPTTPVPLSAGPAETLNPTADSRLSAEEYAAWLLPPQPRDAMEKIVHALSLGAGVVALTAGAGAVWWIL